MRAERRVLSEKTLCAREALWDKHGRAGDDCRRRLGSEDSTKTQHESSRVRTPRGSEDGRVVRVDRSVMMWKPQLYVTRTGSRLKS